MGGGWCKKFFPREGQRRRLFRSTNGRHDMALGPCAAERRVGEVYTRRGANKACIVLYVEGLLLNIEIVEDGKYLTS